jgi:uncharacterized protein (TIGR03437 family)
MKRLWKVAFGVATATVWSATFGQETKATVLEIDVVNSVFYFYDTGDYPKWATDPAPTASVPSKNFSHFIGIGDIVAVNGESAKGVWVYRATAINLGPTPTAGQAIADVVRSNIAQAVYEISQTDGTPVGSIMTEGMGGGGPPPGAPPQHTQGNQAVVGGTGAFLGVRGELGSDSSKNIPTPAASVSEDPTNRRLRKGGGFHFVLNLVPMVTPAVVITSNGPAIVHSKDFTLVSAANPAQPGEILTLFARGLGPLRPAGEKSELRTANSPLEVIVNGVTSTPLYAGEYAPNSPALQVNFKVPPETQAGMASVQLSAAWLVGAAIQIPVRLALP